MKTGIELIAAERQEQIEKHERSIDRDVKENPNRELRDGALVLLYDHPSNLHIPNGWNRPIMYKMINKSYRERLIIAGALIAAEIDRLQST